MTADTSTSKKALILDMDGLMVDTERLFFNSLSDFLTAMGHRLAPEHVREIVGKTTAENSVYLKKAFNLKMNHREIEEGWMRYFEAEIEDPNNIVPLPGLKEVLVLGRDSGARLAVASSSRRWRVEYILRTVLIKLGLNRTSPKFFHEIVAGDDVEQAKPDPAIFLLAAERLGVKPKDCLVLEDSPVGVDAARAAGMKVIAIPSPYCSADELAHSDRVAESLLEVAKNNFFGLLPAANID